MRVKSSLSIVMHIQFRQYLQALVFVAIYVVIDGLTYMHPMHGLNITPWNPPPALGLVLWLRYGRIAAVPWFGAILASELLIRHMPVPLLFNVTLSAFMVIGYGSIAELLRIRLGLSEVLHDQRKLLSWLFIIVTATLATSCLYIAMVSLAGLIPAQEWAIAFARFWVGDCVGIIVTMPFFWMLSERLGRERLKKALSSWGTLGYGLLGIAMLWLAFGFSDSGNFKYFYLLFLPVVWAAARQGLAGAAIAAFVLPTGVIVAAQWVNLVSITMFELQMLGAVLAFVGFFIGVVVDEKQRVSMELQQTLRLAAAGEMAAALAHELNQPLSALSAYGSVSEELLAKGETGTLLRDTIRRMVVESHRAADVVRRLRDFFRTGATRLERISLVELIDGATAPFSARAAQHSIDLIIDQLPDRTLLVDRLQIEVVLRNLLSNAFDAVCECPVNNRQIHISAYVDDLDSLHICIEDSGPGLTAAMAERLFEAFHSSKASGLGLGLPISRAIVEAHGGNLLAKVIGHGLFEVVLPAEGKPEDAS